MVVVAGVVVVVAVVVVVVVVFVVVCFTVFYFYPVAPEDVVPSFPLMPGKTPGSWIVWVFSCKLWKAGSVITEIHGNPKPSFLGVITHILGVWNLHFSWFWGPRDLTAICQWIILVLALGGRDYITPKTKARNIYTWYIKRWKNCQLDDYIYFLPPFTRTWQIHWIYGDEVNKVWDPMVVLWILYTWAALCTCLYLDLWKYKEGSEVISRKLREQLQEIWDSKVGGLE